MPLLRFEAYHVRDQSAAQCGGPRGWLAARRFCILLIVLILDQVIPVIYIYRNLAAVILTSR